MIFPCATHVNCPCGDNPLTNYSSEDPDRPIFLAHNFGFSQPPPMNVPPGNECATYTSSTNSQSDADECAAAAQEECETGTVIDSPCSVCGQTGSQGSSFGFASTGSSTPDDPCCDPDAGFPAECCCSENPGNPNEPPTPPPPPGDPDNPGQPQQPPYPPRTFCNNPQSCTVTCPDGSTFTATVESGRFCAISQTMANQMAHDAACRQAEEMKDCEGGGGTGCNCITLCLDSPADFQVGTAPEEGEEKIFELVNGDLPNGLTMDATGKITGTPGVPGSADVDVKITNGEGKSVILHTCISVLGITTDTLPDGEVENAYGPVQLTAAGGNPPYTFALETALPAGLSFDPETGILSGTPQSGGSFEPLFRVIDSCQANCPVQLELTINGDTNDPVTTNSPCTSNPALDVTVTVPAGTIWHATGYDPKRLMAEAKALALQQAAAALAANGCPCYLESMVSDNQHTGVATAHMTSGLCSLTLVAYSETFVMLAPISITPMTITQANSPIDMDSSFDNFGPGHGSNWPSIATWALYIPQGVPATADNVLFWYHHLAH